MMDGNFLKSFVRGLNVNSVIWNLAAVPILHDNQNFPPGVPMASGFVWHRIEQSIHQCFDLIEAAQK